MTTTGSRIREIRKENKLTQEQFGEKIGIKDSAVSMLEKNERRLTSSVIKNIVAQFCINDMWLMDGTGEKYNNDLLNKKIIFSKPLENSMLDIIKKIQALEDSQHEKVLKFLECLNLNKNPENIIMSEDEKNLLTLYRSLDMRAKEETISFINFKISTREIQKKKDPLSGSSHDKEAAAIHSRTG